MIHTQYWLFLSIYCLDEGFVKYEVTESNSNRNGRYFRR